MGKPFRRGSKWCFIEEDGKHPDGERKQKWHSGYRTLREAQAAQAEIRNAKRQGTYVEPLKLTVEQYLEQWLEQAARPRTSRKTFERYEQIVRVALIPKLGAIPLQKLSALDIQGFYRRVLNERQDGRSGGLSPTTVLHYHRLLRQALQQAVAWKLLAQNPSDGVRPPSRNPDEQSEHDDRVHALDAEGALRLFDALKEGRSWMYLPVVLAVGSGLRRGEILALRWRDVDLEAKTVSVTRTLEQTKDGLAFKAPKTKKSRRMVVLPQFAIDELRRHRRKQAAERLKAGHTYEDQDLIFARAKGEPIEPDALSGQYAQWLKRRADLPRITFHNLRHTTASILHGAGVPAKVVQELLGHEHESLTMGTYTHVASEQLMGAAVRLGEVFDAAIARRQNQPLPGLAAGTQPPLGA